MQPASARKSNAPTAKSSLLVSARREATWIILISVVACLWTVGVCAWLGYGADGKDVPPLVFGFPNWVFWGIVVPWLVATASSLIISQLLMTDEDLGIDAAGNDREEDGV
jgi:hypothetical protein